MFKIKLQNVQIYRISKITKCPKVTKCPKLQLQILELKTFCNFGHFVTYDIL